jgi:hypothetical protein
MFISPIKWREDVEEKRRMMSREKRKRKRTKTRNKIYSFRPVSIAWVKLWGGVTQSLTLMRAIISLFKELK